MLPARLACTCTEEDCNEALKGLSLRLYLTELGKVESCNLLGLLDLLLVRLHLTLQLVNHRLHPEENSFRANCDQLLTFHGSSCPRPAGM